ncbi:flavin reductase [Aminobacter ciceronei]|nr:flavin reductase [Aminobacter ciceronei]
MVLQSPSKSEDLLKSLRRCLSQYSTGVSVVTACVDGVRIGITMNSFASVSLDPPLILWSIRKQSTNFQAFKSAQYFAINVMSSEQIDVSQHFSKSGEDKFSSVKVTDGKFGSPVIEGSLAVIECSTDTMFPGGDHMIVVGRVEHFETSPGEALIFSQGRYVVAQDHPAMAADPALLPRSSTNGAQKQSAELFPSLYWAFNSMSLKFESHRQELGLDIPKTRVLIQLFNNPNISDEALCGLCYLSRSATTAAVEQLLASGHVSRGQGRLLALSEAGVALRKILAVREVEYERTRVKHVPKHDLDVARGVLDAIVSGEFRVQYQK